MEDKNDSPITISDDIKLDTWDLSQENSVKPEHGNDEAVPHVPISKQELRRLAQHHKWDPNIDQSWYKRAKALADDDSDAQEKIGLDIGDLIEDSPYLEVRVAVSNTDDPGNTLRMWTIALLFTTMGSGINMLLSLRQPSIFISSIVSQLLSYPVGRAWGKYMPAWELKIFGRTISLNPCPFNIKEHVLIVVASNVAYGGGVAYATDILVAQRAFYGQNFGGAFAVLLVISTQCLGYAFAGVMRRFLVWPAAMMWPSTLVNATLFRTLFREKEPEVPGWRVSRYRFFVYCLVAMFLWNWIPGYIFTAVRLDLIPLTVDWSQITGFLGSPLMTPFWAIGNIFVAFVFWIWIVTPLIHFANGWYGKYLPISTHHGYDNTGNSYNVSRILNSKFEFDLTKYKAYSPLFLGTTFALTYGLSFASITSVLMHTYLFYSDEIWRQFKEALNQEDDIHMKLNKAYRQAPDWWYVALGVVTLAMSLAVCEGWDTQMPWWALLLAIVVALIFFIPIGIILAISNFQLGLNVLTEFIAAYALPGKPIANMTFKVYGYMAMSQGLTFTQDLKLGHYMHIPPIMMFSVQVIATIWGAFVNVGVLIWAFGNVSGICTPDAVQNFTCPTGSVFFTASVIWGAVGPQRMFERGQIYYANLWFFLFGALAPIPIYLLARRYSGGPWKFFIAPLFFSGTAAIPPATAINYAAWCIMGTVFNFFIKRRHPAWWAKYNYLTSAGFDCGLAISLIVIFVALSLPGGGISFNWWGNVGAFNTADFKGVPILNVGPNETFGPLSW